jgi:3-methylcrotonyl-CoA carboxylase beta subunit
MKENRTTLGVGLIASWGRSMLSRRVISAALGGTITRAMRSCHAGVLAGAIENEPVAENAEAMAEHLSRVRSATAAARQGGGARQVALHRSRSKMLPHERIEALLDPGSPFLELSPLAALGVYDEDVPAAGIVSGIGLIHGRQCMVVANDPTVKGGTLFPLSVKKQLRSQEIARQNRLPCIYLLESGGANLPMQAEIFPDAHHGGKSFANMAIMSGEGIPQISIVLGSCTAGGAYGATMADEVVIVRGKGTIFLGGPPLVKAATGEVVSAEALGGAELHCSLSGCADHMAEDEPHAFRLARQLVADLPPPQPGSLPRVKTEKPLFDPHELCSLVPKDTLRTPLPIRKILARILDGSHLTEFKAQYGPTLITGFGRIHGYQVSTPHSGPFIPRDLTAPRAGQNSL